MKHMQASVHAHAQYDALFAGIIIAATFAAIVRTPLMAQSSDASRSVEINATQNLDSELVREVPTKEEDTAWASVLAAVFGTSVENPGAGLVSKVVEQKSAREKADLLKSFYTRFPESRFVNEARKLEAISLVDAVDSGDVLASDRLNATVLAVRSDPTISSYDRAVVAGTYEFFTARKRIVTLADFDREHAVVARLLIREFPDQPQGYISLVTVAMVSADTDAKRMLAEVLEASQAPQEQRERARLLFGRMNLVGRPLADVLTEAGFDIGDTEWSKGKPGLVYFWAPSATQSLDTARLLGSRRPSISNILGVCLPQVSGDLDSYAEAYLLPGRQLIGSSATKQDVARQLFAAEVPLIYLVDSRGRISDVRGADNLETKLTELGL